MENPVQCVIDAQRSCWGDKIFDVMQEIAELENDGLISARGIIRETACGPVTVVALTFYPDRGEVGGADND